MKFKFLLPIKEFFERFSSPIGALIATVFILIVIGYSSFQARKIIFGPRLVITQLVRIEGSPLITITGKASRVSFLSINDNQIFLNENGEFSQKLLLLPGYNIITIKASDKFKRTKVKTLELFYKEPIVNSIELNREDLPETSSSSASSTKFQRKN